MPDFCPYCYWSREFVPECSLVESLHLHLGLGHCHFLSLKRASTASRRWLNLSIKEPRHLEELLTQEWYLTCINCFKEVAKY